MSMNMRSDQRRPGNKKEEQKGEGRAERQEAIGNMGRAARWKGGAGGRDGEWGRMGERSICRRNMK